MALRFVPLALLLLTASCVKLPVDSGTTSFGPDEEWRLGRQLAGSLEGRLRPHPDAEAQRLAAELARPFISAGALGTREWSVVLVEDPAPYTLHAPGGRLFLSTGLVLALDDAASLSGLLAHEVAHAQLRHGTQQLARSLGSGTLQALARGEEPSLLADLAANIAAGGTFVRYGDEAERQANAEALRLLGDRAEGLRSGLIELHEHERPAGLKRSRHFRCHPFDEIRLGEIEALLAGRAFTTAEAASESWARLRERIQEG